MVGWDGRYGWDGGFFQAFFRVSLVGTIGLVGMVGGSPQVCHLHRPDPTHVGSDPAAPIRPIWIPIQ